MAIFSYDGAQLASLPRDETRGVNPPGRVYDALKRAGQFLDSSEGVSSAQAKNRSDSQMVDITDVLAQRSQDVSARDVPHSLEASEDVLEQAPISAPPQNGLLGTAVSVALNKKARILPHSIEPRLEEYYRIIRTNILQEQSKRSFRSLLVASPRPRDGKTLTVLNLALTFAMVPSFKVLVVDGDLRRGNLGATLGLEDSLGFSNFVENGAKLEDVILKCDTLPMKFIMRGTAKLSPRKCSNRHFWARKYEN